MKKASLKLYIELTVEEKKLNIGAGGLVSKVSADVPFLSFRLLNGEEKLLIPGSTLKGVLRTSLIRISGLLGYDNVTCTVNPECEAREDIVTKLFGRPGELLSSRIIVGNAVSERQTTVLTHVTINDETRTAEKGRIFTVEYLPPGSSLTFQIEAKNVNEEDVRALMAAVANLRFERIGKAGIVNVKIKSAEGLDEFLRDPVVREVYEALKV